MAHHQRIPDLQLNSEISTEKVIDELKTQILKKVEENYSGENVPSFVNYELLKKFMCDRLYNHVIWQMVYIITEDVKPLYNQEMIDVLKNFKINHSLIAFPYMADILEYCGDGDGEYVVNNIDNHFGLSDEVIEWLRTPLFHWYMKCQPDTNKFCKYVEDYLHLLFLYNLEHKDGKKYMFIVDDTDDLIIYNGLIEENKNIKKVLDFVNDQTHRKFDFIEGVDPSYKYNIIKMGKNGELVIFKYCNSKKEAKLAIKQDAVNDSYDSDYYIVNVSSIPVSHFDTLTKNTIEYKYYTGSEFK